MFVGIPTDQLTKNEVTVSYCCAVGVALPMLWILYTEKNQFSAGFFEWLTKIWNILLVFETIGTITIFSMVVTNYNGVFLPITASLLVLILVINLFYWARINFTMAMYSYIVWVSVFKASTFLILVLGLCVAFGSSFLALDNSLRKMSSQPDNLVWEQGTEYESFLDSKLGIPWIDNIFEEFLAGRG